MNEKNLDYDVIRLYMKFLYLCTTDCHCIVEKLKWWKMSVDL